MISTSFDHCRPSFGQIQPSPIFSSSHLGPVETQWGWVMEASWKLLAPQDQHLDSFLWYWRQWSVCPPMCAPFDCKWNGVCVAQASSQVPSFSCDSKQPFSSSGLLNNENSPNTFLKFENETHTLKGRKKMGKREGQETNQSCLWKHKALKIGFISTNTSDWAFFFF